VISELLAHTLTPEPLSLPRLALPEAVHNNRIFFPSREALHECISPSFLPQGGFYSPREMKLYLSPFRVRGAPSSSSGDPQSLGYHATRNSNAFALVISLIL
jgi:hypothetical protein